MITTAREFLESLDALPEQEKHQVVVELLRRSSAEGGISDEAFTLMAEEAFLVMDAEEEAKNAQSKRTAG